MILLATAFLSLQTSYASQPLGSYMSMQVPDNDGKADVGKTRMGLLIAQFPEEIKEVADVLTFGANKYPKPPMDDSWRDVPDGERRYTDALYRHLNAIHFGEVVDEESGLPHIAHAMCNLLFLSQLRKTNEEL